MNVCTYLFGIKGAALTGRAAVFTRRANIYQALVRGRRCAKCFIPIISLNLHNYSQSDYPHFTGGGDKYFDPVWAADRWASQDCSSERLSDLSTDISLFGLVSSY